MQFVNFLGVGQVLCLVGHIVLCEDRAGTFASRGNRAVVAIPRGVSHIWPLLVCAAPKGMVF